MAFASVDSVSVDVITTLIEDGFNDALRDMRMSNAQNSLWEQFTQKTDANGAKNVLQTWMEDIGAMEAWDDEKKFDDLIERRYSVGHTPWHKGVRMKLNELKQRIKQFGAGNVSVGVEAFAADIRNKLAHRASELDIVKVLDQLITPTKLGYDGQALFSANHEGSQSNQDTGGGGEYWYPLCLGGRGRPIIRVNGGVNSEEFEIKDHVSEDTSERYFQRMLYWGVEFDGGWFPGLWQSIYRSNQVLNEANWDAAVQAIEDFKDARGEKIGQVVTHILVGRSNRLKSRKLFEAPLLLDSNAAVPNVNQGEVQIIYSSRLP